MDPSPLILAQERIPAALNLVTEGTAAPPGGTASEEPDLHVTLAAIVGADLHVQRLRQLRDVIGMRLDQRPRGYKKRGESPVPRRRDAA